MVKKLMLLAAMLGMVLVAAVPALAQNIEPSYGDVEPAPGYGDIEPAPGDVEPTPGYGDVEPVNGDYLEPVDCSEALEGSSIVPASEPPVFVPAPDGALVSAPDSGVVTLAEEPGCSEIPVQIPVPAPADGDSA